MPRHLIMLVPHAILALALLTASASLSAAPARGAPAAEWQPTGLTERVWALFTPASGAFFAQTDSGLSRSDDAGASWRPVPLPPGYPNDRWPFAHVAVDPNDHTRVYVGAWVTRDDAATWSPLGPWADSPEIDDVWPLPSAADPSLLYLAVRSGNQVGMLRSRDGGGEWESILKLGPGDFRPSSGVRVTLFETHPSDPNVLFHSVVGFRGNGNQGIVRRSADQGKTLQQALFVPLHVPTRLVGGRGSAPGRFYVALPSEETTSAVYRSDDGGVTWVEAGTFGSEGAVVNIRALTYDPAQPDRVWIGVVPGEVKASEDGGQSWTDMAPPTGAVTDLALGIDGANLYAATTDGVFRLPLR